MKMKKIIFTVLLICIYGLNLYAQPNASKEEYKVYASILKDIYSQNLKEYETKSSFVILNETFKPDNFSRYKINRIRGLLRNFKQRNMTSAKLEESFQVNYNCEIISKSKMDALLTIGRNELERIKAEYKSRNIGIAYEDDIVWKPFYEKYPNSNGYYKFSRVGFSSDKRIALVLVKREASDSGDLMQYILKKIKGKWVFYFAYGSRWDT